MGLYFPFYYIASYCRNIVGMPFTDSLNLLLVLNGMGAIGRIVLNHIGDRVGPLTMYVPVALISSICVLSWMAAVTVPGVYVWAVFYGVAAGGIQSLFPAGLSSLTTDLRKAGVRMGMVFTIQSFAVLSGPPIAGALIGAMDGQYHGAQGFAGAVLFLGTFFIAAARMAKTKKLGKGFWTKV
jgi:MFS family permease